MDLYAELFTGVWRILKNLSINCLPEVKGEVIICFLILSTVLLGRLTSSRVTFDSLDTRNSTEKIIKSNVHYYKQLLDILFYISFWRHSRDFHLCIHYVSNTCTCTNTKIIVIFPRTYMYLFTFTKKIIVHHRLLKLNFLCCMMWLTICLQKNVAPSNTQRCSTCTCLIHSYKCTCTYTTILKCKFLTWLLRAIKINLRPNVQSYIYVYPALPFPFLYVFPNSRIFKSVLHAC